MRGRVSAHRAGTREIRSFPRHSIILLLNIRRVIRIVSHQLQDRAKQRPCPVFCLCSYWYRLLLIKGQRLRLVEVRVDLGRAGERVLPSKRFPSTGWFVRCKGRFGRLGRGALARLR
jgi:hypothetical protein